MYNFEWSQTKTGKQKAFCIFSDRSSHFLGDLHRSGYFSQYPASAFNNEEYFMHWMFPNLRSMSDSSVSSKVTKILRAQVGKVAGVPADVSSGSIRVTALCEMDAAGVWPHRMAAISGHDLKGWSAMWEYILITIASVTPGKIFLIIPNYHNSFNGHPNIGMMVLTGWKLAHNGIYNAASL